MIDGGRGFVHFVRSNRGRLPSVAGRVLLAAAGLSVFALGVTMNIQSGLGLQPWWAFHFGMTLLWPIKIGQASMLVGVVMVGLSWLLSVRPGPATAMNIVIVGLVTDALNDLGVLPEGSGGLDSYVLLLGGVVVTGLGTAIYVKGNLGAGPRDSFMLGVAYYLQGRVGLARNVMDIGVTLLGWLMGAPIGIGTLVFAVGLGPSIAFWFRLLRVSVRRRAGGRSLVGPRRAPVGHC